MWSIYFITTNIKVNYNVVSAAATILILMLYFYHLRHPEILLIADQEIYKTPKHGRSKITHLDKNKTIHHLQNIMEEEQPYLQEDLSLPDLADMAGLSTHQLSEILNHELGITFKTFINRYRVRDAKIYLDKKTEASILSIALECGFRSKSAFNKRFYEETGMTPTEFRHRTQDSLL